MLLTWGQGTRSASGIPVTADLAAWFRFNSGVTAAQWNDASGNGRHLKQATATNQPAVQGDGSLLFDGVDNFMKCDAFTLNRPFSIYLLLRQVTWTSGDIFFDGDTLNRLLVQQITASPQIRLADSGQASTTSSDLVVNTYGVVFASVSGVDGVLQVNKNARILKTMSGNEMGGFTLGANGSPANYSNIQVKEVALYSAAHDATTHDTITDYLLAL